MPETGKYGPVYDKDTGEWSDNGGRPDTKFNSAYALGGPKCLVKVIQKISGLAINRFMAVDFAGFAKMVDARRRRGLHHHAWTTRNSARSWPPRAARSSTGPGR